MRILPLPLALTLPMLLLQRMVRRRLSLVLLLLMVMKIPLTVRPRGRGRRRRRMATIARRVPRLSRRAAAGGSAGVVACRRPASTNSSSALLLHVSLVRLVLGTTTTSSGGTRLEIPRLDVRPERAGGLAVAAVQRAVPVPAPAGAEGAATACAAAAAEDVVLVVPDRLGREQLVQPVAVGRLLGPPAHRLEHVALDGDALVARGRVVEGAQHVVDHLVDGHAGVLPGVEDPAFFG